MKHRGWIFFSGILWLIVGIFLLYKGTQFTKQPNWIIAGLSIGLLKGLVLKKTAGRMVSRIFSLSTPIRFRDVYTLSYLLLIIGMISLGFVLRFLPDSIHGMIDIAVGVALIRGASYYFICGIGSRVQSQ